MINQAMNEFDYIIVGGGSSGCVLAARLSERPENSVLLIESGRRDTDQFIHIPAGFFKVIEKRRDAHFYRSEAEPGSNDRVNIVPQGNVIGGGSSINAMIYIRGHPNDYDNWARMGATGWSYRDVLPVFRSLEGNERLRGDFHGSDGPLRVSDRRFTHPLSAAFVQAAQEAGLPPSDNFNGAQQEGVGFYQTTTRDGRRGSAAVSFLRDAQKRPNLTVMTRARVARVLFESKRAVGVQLLGGDRYRCRAEVVLTAGAIATPKILQLSGLGDAQHLMSHGIDVVADLPGVGENYQDHLEATVQCEVKDPISLFREDKGLRAARHMAQYLASRTGILSSNVVESGGFVDTSGCGQPDVQFHVIPAMVGFGKRKPIQAHGFSIGPCCLQPRSRGTVKLRSSDPADTALFHTNAFSDAQDVATIMRGVRLAIRITEQPALATLVKRRHLPEPGVEDDDDALADYVRGYAKTVFHPSGTAKIGAASDKMAVVDEFLRVRGVQALRVADASVMPTLVSGNTNAPTIMIGARAAQFITQQNT